MPGDLTAVAERRASASIPAAPSAWIRRLAPLAILAVAFALRTVALDRFPPGLYHDEAYYGLDAVGVLHGDLHVYFPANNGREPLYIYLVSLAVAVLGPTALALRLTAAFVGTLTVAATYALGAQLFGRRVGLAASAFMAVTLWPVWLSRIGFRAGTLPCVLALAVAATARAARSRSGPQSDRAFRPASDIDKTALLFAGLLAGFTLYTYTASRILPLLALGMAMILVVQRRLLRSTIVPWLMGAVTAALPLLIHFICVPEDILGRVEQVMVGAGAGQSGTASGLGEPAAMVWRNVLAVAGMLFVRGDTIPRHNVEGAPVFTLFAVPALALGIAVLLAGLRGRRAPSHFLVILWLLILALPTILAQDAPHYLRAAGLLPALMLLPALAASGSLPKRWSSLDHWAIVLVAVGVAADLAQTTTALRNLALVVDGTSVPASLTGWNTRFAFEDAASTLAAEVRAALDAGQKVWLDRRLRDGWASVPYLAPMDRVTLADPYDPVLRSVPGVAFLMADGLDLDAVWSALPSNIQLQFTDGPAARGDLDAEARTLYVRVDARPPESLVRPLARFAEGMVLVSASAAPDPARLGADSIHRDVVTLTWQASLPITQDLKVFIRAMTIGSSSLATVDETVGGEIFSTHRWPAGLQVREVRTLSLQANPAASVQPAADCLVVGLYHWPDLSRLAVVGDDGRVIGDQVVIRLGKAILNGSACR